MPACACPSIRNSLLCIEQHRLDGRVQVVFVQQGYVAQVELMISRPSHDAAVPTGKPAQWLLRLSAQDRIGLQLSTQLRLAVCPGMCWTRSDNLSDNLPTSIQAPEHMFFWTVSAECVFSMQCVLSHCRISNIYLALSCRKAHWHLCIYWTFYAVW